MRGTHEHFSLLITVMFVCVYVKPDYMYVYKCMYVCIYNHYVYMYVCTYVCMHVCTYVCMHVHMYVCMYRKALIFHGL